MTDTSVLWIRPDLQFPQPFDTIFFDIDGVLIQTITSFHATDIAVAEYVTGTMQGLDWGQREGKPLVTMADVEAFKQAGGYNNDWDMCYLLSSLSTARLREWRGTPLATRTSLEWAALAREAHLQGHGGREWVETTIPASALLDYMQIGDLYHETYWGANGIRRWFGHEPRHLPNAPGLVHTEKMLYSPDFPARLRQLGIKHLGMITGRVGPEVTSALERMEAYSGEQWWNVVISADICPKPDPRALRLAIDAVEARGGLYIGDTADDYDLVRRYNASRDGNEPAILAAMLVSTKDLELYKARGADIIVDSVEALLHHLPLKVA
jgi:HAD superfamily phosphatase